MKDANSKVWTDAEVVALRRMWDDEGMSATAIAAELGGLSRSAVIGKVHRLKLSKRREPSRQPKQHALRRSSPTTRRWIPMPRLPVVKDGDTRAAKGPAWCALPGTTPVKMVDLEHGMCKWPIGDSSPYLFCGSPAGEASYCEHHAARSVGRGTPSERAADELSVAV